MAGIAATCALLKDQPLIGSELRHKLFEGAHIVERRRLSYVSAVQKNVDAHSLYALFFRLRHHGFKVVDVRMYVAVAE